MKHWIIILVSPLLSAALLAGMGVETLRHIKPADVEPFHARARAAIEAYPLHVGDWIGSPVEEPREAVQLLRPNIILSRRYVNTNPREGGLEVKFLIVQCRDSRDMYGHYPPKCYPSNGYAKLREEPRDWTVAGQPIAGMEYEFEQRRVQGTERSVVLNFFVIPGKGVARDMTAVAAAAEDYQERYYGAAQFQVIFPATVARAQRDAIFADLIGARPDVIGTLSSGGIHER